MTNEDIEKIRFAAELNGELDKYVYLREDADGKYIEYAFIEGAPHDNRCLSWYDSYQERELEESKETWEKNKEFHNGEPFVAEDHICKVGNPANRCRDTHCKYWTYKEPVKCACWHLREPDVPKYVNVPIDLAMRLIKLDS